MNRALLLTGSISTPFTAANSRATGTSDLRASSSRAWRSVSFFTITNIIFVLSMMR